MRRMTVACLVTILTLSGVGETSASEGFEGLVKVVKSGADEKTVMEYVAASPAAYSLTVDEILYLSDLGLSAETIKAIAAHSPNTGAGAADAIGAEGPATEEPATNVDSLLEHVGVESGPSGTETIEEMPEEGPTAREVVQETVETPPVVAAPATNAVDYTTFYGALSPYGNWLDIGGEWCWQPTAMLVDRGWSPYCQRGRWVYSDCGWVWESSYSWGWAPFHYGRWRHHPRYRWIWRPDMVWGPAWVCWRYSDSAIGWAPLPPTVTFEANAGLCFGGRQVSSDFEFGLGFGVYTFVPVERFCEFGVSRYRYPRSRVQPAFFPACTVQNRIAFRDGRICNFGPPSAHVSAGIHREVRPVTVVDLNVREGEPIPRPRHSGGNLWFYRPLVAPNARENPRQVVVGREARESGWSEAGRRDELFSVNRGAPAAQLEWTRGRESRGAPHGVIAPAISASTEILRREQPRLTEAMARQRQAEEAAARRQEAERRRADQLIQARNAERQGAQEQVRQRALTEQQQRETTFLRQQEERRRAEDVIRQQESQSRMQEATRAQQRQRENEAVSRAVEGQRQALRVQREAEEALARRQEQQAWTRRDAGVGAKQRETYRAPSDGIQDYGDAWETGAASSRGALSRDHAWRSRGR